MFSTKALLFVAQSALLMASAVSASYQNKKLDCSAVAEISNLDRYRDVCSVVHALGKTDEKISFSLPNRLDIVETCTCNLLRHQLVWESMITHEVDTLFLAIRKLIENKLPEDVVVKRDHEMFQQDGRGDEMYFWDSFTKVLNSVDVTVDGPQFSDDLMEYFTTLYYQPETFTTPFQGKKRAGMSALLTLISGICKQTRENFDVYFTYFKNLKELSGNPRFFYRIATYDENLFKLFAVRNMCEFMSFAGSLV